MSRRVGKPVTQKRLTNVAIVRLKRGRKRFEIAAYRNKVVNWRNGVETDLDEVLQTPTIFYNVSKGTIAPSAALLAAFDTDDQEAVCKIILAKGVLQVSDRERAVALSNSWKDVATIIAEKCVNPESQRPYPVTVIERAMREVHFAVSVTRSPKQQALELIHQLKEVLPLERAKMRLRIVVPSSVGSTVQSELERLGAELAGAVWGADYSVEALLLPGHFRSVDELIGRTARGKGSLEVLELAVVEGSDDVAFDGGLEDLGVDAGPPRMAVVDASGGGGGSGRGGAGSDDDDSDEDPAEEVRGPMTADDLLDSLLSETKGEDGGSRRTSRRRKPKRERKNRRKAKKAASALVEEAASSEAADDGGADADAAEAAPARKFKCNSCATAFVSRKQHREHFRSDWHRFNLKRKLRELPPMAEEEFLQISEEELSTFFSEIV